MTTTPANEELIALRKKARRRLVGAIALVLVSLVFLWNVLDSAPPPSIVNNQPVAIVSNSANLNAAVKPVSPILPAPQVAPTVDAKPIVNAPSEPVSPRNGEPSTSSVVTVPVSPVVPLVKETPRKAEAKPEVKSTPGPVVTKPEKPVKSDPAKILAGEENHTSVPKVVKKDSKDDKPSKPADDGKGQGRFVVQIGAFADSSKAKSLQAKLKSAGLNVISEIVDTPKGKLTRLRMAPFSKRTDAEKASAKVRAAGGSGAIVGK